MIIGALKEKNKFENRVAISPEETRNYVKSGHQVLIEKSAGLSSGFLDSSYKEAGASITSSKEILNKSRSLKGVMEPFSNYGNESMLVRSGFKDITPVFQWVCFKGYLAIK